MKFVLVKKLLFLVFLILFSFASAELIEKIKKKRSSGTAKNSLLTYIQRVSSSLTKPKRIEAMIELFTEKIDLHSNLSVFMLYLNPKSLSTKSKCQKPVEFKVGDGKACFGFFGYNLCRKLESFVYHSKEYPGLIPKVYLDKLVDQFDKYNIDLKLYVDLTDKMINGYFLKSQCLVGLTLNQLNPFTLLKSPTVNKDKNYSVLALCSKDIIKIEDFLVKFNQLYYKNMLNSTNYFSIQGFSNDKGINSYYFSEKNSEIIEDVNVFFKSDTILISDKNDNDCKDIKFTNGFQQFMQCLPTNQTNSINKYVNSVEDNLIANSECCLEMTVDRITQINRNLYCFKTDAQYDCKLKKKLFEVTMVKNCLINHLNYYKKLTNMHNNKLKCLNKANITSDIELIKFKNAVRLSKILYNNIREWKEDVVIKLAPMFISENSNKLIRYLDRKTKNLEVYDLIGLKDRSLKIVNSPLKEMLNIYVEKEYNRIKKEIEAGMTADYDAETSVNIDWLNRGSSDLNNAPVDEFSSCSEKVKPKVDPKQEINEMNDRIKQHNDQIAVEEKKKKEEEEREREKAKQEEEKLKQEEQKKKDEGKVFV